MNLKPTLLLPLFFAFISTLGAQSRGSVNYTQEIFSYSSSQTEVQINNQIPIGIPSWLVNLLVGVDNGITGYKVNYNTIDHNNQPIVATGLIIVPDVTCDVDMLTYCHGTVFDPLEVPSNESGAGDGMEIIMGYYYSANGYLTVMPDYIGLGPDATMNHLYVHEDTEAAATRDLMVAAKNLQNTLGYDLTGDVMMTGYSQGGHAAMSTFKDIIYNPISGLNLQVGGMGSGPYNLSGSQYNMIINNPFYENPEFMLYVMATCQTVNGNIYNTPSDILRAPYDNLYTTHILGQTGNVDWVPSYYPSMFQPGVYYDLKYNFSNPTRQCLAQNNVYDWYHTKPLEMYYCTGDNTVTYVNSFDAEEAMEDYYPWWKFWLFGQVNAAYAGWFDHGTCVIPYAVLNKLELEFYQSWCWWWFDEEEADQRSAADEGIAIRTRMYYNLDIDVSHLKHQISEVEFLDLNGETALLVNNPTVTNQLISIPVSDLAAGLYGVNITDETGKSILTAVLKADVKPLVHESYDPVTFNIDLNQIELDLSLLDEEVDELNIYENGVRLDRIQGNQEDMTMLIDASELPREVALEIQVITKYHQYFLPVVLEQEQSNTTALYVYPNPTSGAFNVEADHAFNQISIYDAAGKLVFTDQLDSYTRNHNFDLILETGMYQIIVTDQQGNRHTERLIIK